jgi:hypothetical protein
LTYYKLGKKDHIEITKYKTKYVTIQRDYDKMSCSELQRELYSYDTEPFYLDMYHIGDSKYQLTGKVYKRTASRDVKIECGTSGNWKMYAGVAGVVTLGVIYGVYKISK